MRGLSRLIGIRGAAPVPGEDAPNAPWREAMRAGEVAVFCFDRDGRSINPTGKKAQTEMLEVALAFRSRFAASLMMRGVQKKYTATVAMYDKRGRWLETRSAEGVRLRNETLEYTKRVLQYPFAVACGIFFLIGMILVRARYFGGFPLDWTGMTPSERGSIVVWGGLLGLITRWVLYVVRLFWIKAAVMPALAPMGSAQREEFYRQMERRKNDTLTPLDAELQVVEIPWPDREQHATWAKDYERLGFELVGSYRVLQTVSFVELYVNPEKSLTGTISYASLGSAGMWVDMTTRYEDGLLFSVVAKESAGLDPHPKRKSVRLPRTATIDEVFQKMMSERPQGPMLRVSRELVIPRFKQSWREYVEWRRQRGTTAEEYKRIDERRAARKRGEFKMH
jgi:hypothetical protein